MRGEAESAGSGARVGRYVIDAWLASGGMADVYRARAHGAAGVVKELAIKRVSARTLDSARAVERFVTEARLSMQLSHASIVAVFDFGRADDGYYLAMEWIDGVDLASLLGRLGDPHPLPTAVVAYVGSQIARALQHAHEQPTGTIVHRDVKPSNVLLSRAGDVKLGDFGVAITMGDERTIAGTRGYMAPEQARGDAAEPSHDIYGLGKVLLEIAVGFRVEEAEIEARLATIDPALSAVVGPMLAPDAASRTESAQRAASQLERVTSLAMAGGEEAPRDELVRLVANALAHRGPATGSASHPERLESFALHATAPAVDFASGLATRDALPRAGTIVEETPPGTRTAYEPPRRGRVVLGVAALVLLAFFFLRTQRREHAAPTTHTEPRSVTARAPAPARPPAPALTSAPANETPPAPVTAPAEPPARRVAQPTHDTVPRPARPDASPAPVRTTDSPSSSTEAVSGTGLLSVAARPWANVFVDGRAHGVTPVLGLQVSAGTHRVRLENDALGVSRTVTVDVPLNGRRNVSVELTAPAEE